MKSSTTDQTISAYNTNAKKYASKFDNFEVYKNKISDFHRKYIPTGSNILDLGCGPGNNIKTIFEEDKSIYFTGIDLSKEFINISKQRFPQFTFEQQDIRNLVLSKKFEVVIASFCIVHLKDEETQKFMKNISNILDKNGFLYLSYMNGKKSGFETTSFSNDKIFFNYYTDEFIINILSENNINILEISKENYSEPDGSTTIDTFIYAKK